MRRVDWIPRIALAFLVVLLVAFIALGVLFLKEVTDIRPGTEQGDQVGRPERS